MLTRLAIFLISLSLNLNLWFAVTDPSWLMLPAILVGWYLADAASGIIHMYMDYRQTRPGSGLEALYFYEGPRGAPEYQALFRSTMTHIGPIQRLIFDFKNHHPRPDALGRRRMLEQIGSTVIFVTLPESLALNLACIALPVPGWLVTVITVMLIGGTFAQYFHGTLHRDKNPRIILIMRKLHLLMTPEAHEKHHATLQRDFSTNSGWSNPVLNKAFNWLRRHGRLADEGLIPREAPRSHSSA